MGWNEIYDLKTDLYTGFGNRIDSDSDKSIADALLHPYSYFVHSYYVETTHTDAIAAQSDYPFPFTCAVAQDNIFAVQFHPEKSQLAGLTLLSNFAQWTPRL